MGCGSSSAGDKGMSVTELAEETKALFDEHADGFERDFERDLLPLLQKEGAKDLDDEDSVNYAKCCEIRGKLFEKHKEKYDALPEKVLKDANATLLPRALEGLSPTMKKFAEKASMAAIKAAVTKAHEGLGNDLKEPPLLDKRLKRKLKEIIDRGMPEIAEMWNGYLEGKIKENGKKNLDEFEDEKRNPFLKSLVKSMETDKAANLETIAGKMGKEFEETIYPVVDKKIAARKWGGPKAKIAKTAATKTCEMSAKNAWKGFVNKEIAKDAALQAKKRVEAKRAAQQAEKDAKNNK